jgi:hypothetical protein
LREIFENDRRHIGQRALRVLFQNENGMFRADFLDFTLERRRDIPRGFIGDDRDALIRLQAQTIPDRVPRARLKLRIDGYGVGAVRHGVSEERSALREKSSLGNPIPLA